MYMNFLYYSQIKSQKETKKRRNFIPEELLISCASGGPRHQSIEGHPDIPAGH
jgi:hypothetical protein